MAKNIKRPIRFVARKNTDPVGTVTEWGAWRKGKKGIAKKTFPGTHAKKKTLTNKSTNTSPQRKILFTGLDKADFKMGNKMLKVVREAVKKHGKENVTLIHGGRTDVSKVDQNIEELGQYTGLKVEADPLQYSKYPKNAAGARTQKRIDDPELEWYSFDKKGNLSKKDKYQTYWKNKYGDIGKETRGGKLKFPRSTVKDNKVIGKSTKDTTKFKTLLDEIESDTNPERRASGVRYAKNVDRVTKENFGFNMITEKNQDRIDFLEKDQGLPSFKSEYKTYDDFEQTSYIEDTSVLGREGQTEYGGSGRLPSGFKAENKGTLLTGKKKVRDSGNLTDRQILKKNPYPQSSLSQIVGSSEYEDYKGLNQEGGRKVEVKNSLRQLTEVTDITEEATGEDKAKSGKGIERHKTSHLLREQPIKDRVELKRALKRAAPVFQRIAEAKKTARTSGNIPRRVRNLKRIDKITRKLAKRIPDRLAFDAAQPVESTTPARSSTVQSSDLKNVPVPSASKPEKDKLTRAKIAKGPYGGIEKQGTEQHYKGWSDRTKKFQVKTANEQAAKSARNKGLLKGLSNLGRRLSRGLGPLSVIPMITGVIREEHERKKRPFNILTDPI
tara:strand:- start:496 stop:2328 length:1833 start_codon:yes stop_codon:yes gene_type:complete